MLNIKKGFYTDLDTLLDTRFGVLRDFDEKLAMSIIGNEAYFERIYDEFDYVNNSLFRGLYDKRDNKVLRQSPATRAVELLASEFTLLENKLALANEIPLLTLTINTYPFTLSENEMNGLSYRLKLLMLNMDITIAFINIPPKDITLNFIATNFSLAILYDYSKWLDYQILNKTGNAEHVKLYVPSIVGKGIPVKKEKDLEDMFNAHSEIFGGYIDLTNIPTETYCMRQQYREKLLSKK